METTLSSYTLASMRYPANSGTPQMSLAPYPAVTGKPNPQTVAMLKDDYAGIGSELTAVTQYIFQHFIGEDKAFCKQMELIAVNEMKHLNLLGSAITALGGSPRFDDTHHFWNSAYVNYTQPLEDMLKANIAAETGAIESYEKHAAQTNNASVRALLLRIIDDERVHLKYFQDKLAQLH